MGLFVGLNKPVYVKRLYHSLAYSEHHQILDGLNLFKGFPGGTGDKESACQCRRSKRRGFNPWFGKLPWSRKWQNLLPYSCLKNSMDRGAWWVTVVHGAAKSWT